MKLKIATLLLLLSFVWAGRAAAFDYGEHKAAGEMAFGMFLDGLVKDGYFKDRQEEEKFFSETLNMKKNPEGDLLYFSDLSNPPNYITYGVLDALSGDQSGDPLSLREELMYRYSHMNQIVDLESTYMQKFQNEATTGEIMDTNPSYAYLAVMDQSHFHDYGRSLEYHLGKVDRDTLEMLKSPKTADQAFSRLRKVNSITKYVTLHAFSVYLAGQAGKFYATDVPRSNLYLAYAFLYSSFADHFLADGFASGHIVVNRSLFSAIINNKALHDFYCANGVEVVNLKGDVWKTYGDHMLERYPGQWKSVLSYDDIVDDKITLHERMLVQAEAVSIREVWQAYQDAKTGKPVVNVVDDFPEDDSEEKEKFSLDNFKALSLMPLPFNSDLKRYNLPPEKMEKLQDVNAMPANRNFVRSRVANSVIAEIGYYDVFGAAYDTIGLRLDVSRFSSYNDTPNKAGTVDRWAGYTFSYLAGYANHVPMTTKVSGGMYCDFDFWVTKKKYFGLYSYLEAGIERNDGINRFAFSPSVGLQFGPLFGLDDYVLPRWLWVPMQFVLPLKLVFGANVVPSQITTYNITAEIDLLF
ncbi:MAG: hypothetical protein WCS77_03875 [Elusimicrobiaceae bacterium]